jgi:hypothetical protein
MTTGIEPKISMMAKITIVQDRIWLKLNLIEVSLPHQRYGNISHKKSHSESGL